MKMENMSTAKIIVYAAIIVGVPRWAGAFISADTTEIPPMVEMMLQWGNVVAGLGMAILEVGGTAYLLEQWGKLKPKKTHNAKSYDWQWVILTFFIGGVFLMVPLILAPYIMARMNSATLSDQLPVTVQWLWSVAVTLSPAFIAGGAFVAESATKKAQPMQPKRQPAQPSKQPQMVQPMTTKQVASLPELQLKGTKLAVYNAYKSNPNATQQEIASEVGISRQAVGKHVKSLNGALSL